MERLTNREMQSLLNSISVVHSNQDTESLEARIFKAVKQIIPTEFSALDFFRPCGEWLGRDIGATEPANATTPEHGRIFAAYVHENPLFTEFLRTGLPVPRK